ncbi:MULTISPECIES: FAD-dependent monooxygenase [unclassified Microbacterium]|uniref:FAD-dependent monooxygenase n=1 Tax=unclassified Microbacterium TaxID=2609290 RepID=UPI00214D1013|nr:MULTISPECIES: FAD-dependent monooxygenase [unclassified Microbacterium]MCR2784066.1 FAD-dependent monooxygenase [Microbacterium sp. zg.B96]WIM15094.1 FAD-dependent monooxygenase [Microbacterium sp. zg-B96]
MRIAVIGAGIGGLVAAAGLQSDGHEVTVFEQRQKPSPDGAGLTLFSNAFEALDLLGLGDVVRSISSGAIASMRSGQRHPSGSWLITVPQSAVASMRSVHRVELHRALTGQLQAGTLRTGSAALVASDGSPHVTVNARTEHFDLVVVADGIRSRNRVSLGLDAGLHYAGYTAWRGVTSRPVDIHGEAGESWGRGQLFGIVPLPDDHVYWFGTLTTAAGTVFRDEYKAVQRQFDQWHDPIQECITATQPDAVMRHDIYDLAKPLPSFVRGRAVLLGDAAHAMTPNLGQGAGQGIEDAATLALLLRNAGINELDSMLARYSDLRRKRTSTIQQRSRMAGRVAQAANPLAVGLRNAALRLTPGKVMGALSQRIHAWPKTKGA